MCYDGSVSFCQGSERDGDPGVSSVHFINSAIKWRLISGVSGLLGEGQRLWEGTLFGHYFVSDTTLSCWLLTRSSYEAYNVVILPLFYDEETEVQGALISQRSPVEIEQ